MNKEDLVNIQGNDSKNFDQPYRLNDYTSKKDKKNEIKDNILSEKIEQINYDKVTEIFDKNTQSRNEGNKKVISNIKPQHFVSNNNVTVLSNLDNPTMKDFTIDSNIMLTNRDILLKEKFKKMDLLSFNNNQINNSTLVNNNKQNNTNVNSKFNKDENINIYNKEEEKNLNEIKINTIEQNREINKIEKTKTIISEIDSKRAKFFEKMTGMVKINTEEKQDKKHENILLSKTMKPTDNLTRKSFNINSLIKNLEIHVTG